jgi:shikimate dehydrogenase
MAASSKGAAPLAGVIGWPIGHSLSPVLHGHWLARYRLAGAYVALPVSPDRLDAALTGLGALGFAGANVTVPHKEAAARLADRPSETVARIGAANTLVIGEDGTIAADSTDGYGFLANLDAGAPDWPADRPAVVIGAGGAARAIVDALQQRGCPEIRVVNRTHERAEALARALAGAAGHVIAVEWVRRSQALDGAGLVVNTTTQGMTGQPPLDLALDALPAGAVVNDIVYAPLETPLLAAARARGLTAVDGLGMLLHQAVPGFAAWFGLRPMVDAAARGAVLAALAGRD